MYNMKLFNRAYVCSYSSSSSSSTFTSSLHGCSVDVGKMQFMKKFGLFQSSKKGKVIPVP